MSSAYFRVLCLFAGLLLLVGACALIPGSNVDPLEGTSWVLETYGKSRPIPGTTITATFEEGNVRGSAGCNTYQGAYVIDGERIEFSEVAWTLMACQDPEGVMEQEQRVMRIMGGVERFQLADGKLVLQRADHEMLIFVPQTSP
jgi:heat shock protein HslJ